MTGWLDHLIIVPIILPLMAAAGMLLLDERRRILKGLISLAVMTGILAAAILLLNESATGAADGGDVARVEPGGVQGQRGFGVGTDHQDLDLLQHLQGVDQPLDARVEAPPALFVAGLGLGLVADFRVEVGVLAQW